jgi:hypothetical protein
MEAGPSSPLKRKLSDLTPVADPDIAMIDNPEATYAELPASVLLVSLPGMLIHPPTHKLYALSLSISLLALRRCLALPNLTPDIECRAWTSLAEVGTLVIAAGFNVNEDHAWAAGIENEVCI